jgi:hypothetical protein
LSCFFFFFSFFFLIVLVFCCFILILFPFQSFINDLMILWSLDS